MSSTNKTANYELSQFVGTDIPSILNDYNGDMRKIDSAIKNASVAGGDNAVAIAELQSTTARMNTEIGGINSTVNTIGGKVVSIEEVIPATASAQNKLLTAQELPEIPSITELEGDVAELQEDVGDIKACIPSNASASNKFATQDDIPQVAGKIRCIEQSRVQVASYSNWTDLLSALRSAIDNVVGNENFDHNIEVFMNIGDYSVVLRPSKAVSYYLNGFSINHLDGSFLYAMDMVEIPDLFNHIYCLRNKPTSQQLTAGTFEASYTDLTTTAYPSSGFFIIYANELTSR